jgi:hypothetical protein
MTHHPIIDALADYLPTYLTDPPPGNPFDGATTARFWSKVEKREDGTLDLDGFPLARLPSQREGQLGRRIAWEIVNGVSLTRGGQVKGNCSMARISMICRNEAWGHHQ